MNYIYIPIIIVEMKDYKWAGRLNLYYGQENGIAW